MKLFLSTIFSIVISGAQAQTWNKIWADEFNTNGLPDSASWGYEKGCSLRNGELQDYREKRLENTRVENGNLIIEAHKEVSGTCNYTSGSITTRHKVDWTYGKIEVRAKLPKGKGVWPAIWMMSTDEEFGWWPKSGEIDIMENVGFDPNKVHFTIHTEINNHMLGTGKGANTLIDDPHDTFHIYAMEWYTDRLDFFVDGVKYFTYNKESDDPKVWPFNKRFYLIMNLAIGGGWGGVQGIDDTIFPNRMTVDYVRLYQLQNKAKKQTKNKTKK
jgi:beta-glucanase (GH16 family)